jgi:hypothetical protein
MCPTGTTVSDTLSSLNSSKSGDASLLCFVEANMLETCTVDLNDLPLVTMPWPFVVSVALFAQSLLTRDILSTDAATSYVHVSPIP